ncbi:hypothetical protein M3Y99_01763500 [Aphelenchoides fujianensis]|nr:hypothetical protein M3Y99_01763500 [Aphelenchoides fujianensis]
MLARLVIVSGNLPAAPAVRSFATSSLRSARFGGGPNFTQQGFKIRTQTGPTLRERLLGPTTGKPFIYGTYAIAGASVFGIGMLGWYGLGLSKAPSAMDRASLWPEYVRKRLQHTYAYLGGSLAITSAAALAASRSPAILQFMSAGGLAHHGAWLLHSGIMGAVLAPLCLAGGPVLIRAAWYTAALCAGLTATALCAPSEKPARSPWDLGVVFAANIGSFFFPPHTALGASLAAVVVYGGLILFSAFLLFDTQRIIRQAELQPAAGAQQTFYNQYGEPVQTVQVGGFDPISSALSLYMDVLNIFIRMVMILGMGQNRRK